MADLLTKMPFPYEPKKKNRFILRFPDSLGINEWFVQSTNRPKISIKPVDIAFLNTKRYVAGMYEWGTITVKLLDPIGPSAAQAMMEWVRLHAEEVTGRMGYAAGYKKDVELEMLDPTGVVIEKWSLIQCFITEADFGGLSYSEDALADISITLRPDYCVLLY